MNDQRGVGTLEMMMATIDNTAKVNSLAIDPSKVQLRQIKEMVNK